MNLRLADMDDFNNVYAIMEKSFPIDEYRPYQKQKDLLNNPKYKVYLHSSTNNKIFNGFITVWQFDNFAFVEHLAVSPDCRNLGIGSKILNELSKMLSCQICLEVELPDTPIAKRRIEFYKRNGFYLNDYPYTQPAYSKERNEIPMILMTTQKPINETAFNHFKFALYKEVYNVNINQ